jgi:hypothetical protein
MFDKFLKNNNGIVAIIVLILIAFGVYKFSEYLTMKGKYGHENYSSGMDSVYSDASNQPFRDTDGLTSNNPRNIQNPTDLLPGDNHQWSSLNPNGKGELSNISLLQAGSLVGINSVSGSLRNGNLTIRSEPPNPQNKVSPWNNTTITGDSFRRAFEIGQGEK